jgi:uncharacterized protein involved in tellurium resistance
MRYLWTAGPVNEIKVWDIEDGNVTILLKAERELEIEISQNDAIELMNAIARAVYYSDGAEVFTP